jgi:excinuclease UvrABC nuclease subunit
MRRCTDDLHPDPSFPGCVYSEMKMCLAPCFNGCADHEYHAEVARVQAFFDSAGQSLARELAELRERASTALALEEAAAVHTKIEKLKPLVAQIPEIVRRVDRLDALIIQPNAEPDAVCLFRFRNAQIIGPITFRIELRGDPGDSPVELTKGARPKTLESRIEDTIHSFPPPKSVSANQDVEHLSILKRWYYRSHRIGEIFFADERGAWPYRRIVRGIGRVHRGEKREELAGFSPAQESSRLP